MKIKGSVEKIKPVHLISAFLFGLISCTVLRVIHSIKYINAQTGFYEKTDFTVVLFYVILAAVIGFILIGGMLSAKNRELEENMLHSNTLLGISSAALCFGMLTDVLYSLLLSSYSGSSGAGDSFTFLMKSGSLPYRLQALFAFLSFIFFLVFAVNCFRKKGKITSKRILALMPVGWACTKMIPLFVKQISFIRVSDLVLEILAVIFLIVYTLSLAQCISGIYSDVAMWRLTAVGLVVALVTMVLNLPKLAFTLIGKSELYITSGYPLNPAELIFGVFALVLIYSLFSKAPKAEETTEIADKE